MKKALRRVKSVFHGWFGSPSSQTAKKGRQARPQLEILEDRCVPAVFTVDSLSDAVINTGGHYSLRGAIEAANTNSNPTAVDVINFKQGLTGTILLTNGEQDITESVKISGPGSGKLTVSGDVDGDKIGDTRLFSIFNADGAEGAVNVNVTISGLKLTFGNAMVSEQGSDEEELVTTGSAPDDARGGAVRASLDFGGTLTIQNCVVTRNVAGDEGGAIAMVPSGQITSTVADDTSLNLVIQGSTFANNKSGTAGGVTGNEGGAVFFNTGGKFTLENDTFKNNTADQAHGGAVSIRDGSGKIANCKFLSNTAGAEGGALYLRDAGTKITDSTFSKNKSSGSSSAPAPGQGGGAIYQAGATVTLTGCTIDGNTAINNAADFSTGFSGAEGQLTRNGTAFITGDILRLTNVDPSNSQAGSAFTNTPLDVTGFSTQFTFQLSAGANTADGIMFVIQGQSPTALGAVGGNLGYSGISSSVGVKFDLFNNNGEGNNSTGLFTNGDFPSNPGSIDLTPSGINLHSGHPMLVKITYDGTTLTVRITDTITKKSATQHYAVDITGGDILDDNTGYVGFTGGTGNSTAQQDILNWTFTQKADGGGIYHDSGTLMLSNCTISGNKAPGGDGGGIYSGGSGNNSVTLTNCTVTLNRALRGGGIASDDSATINILNTIVAGNFNANAQNDLFREGAQNQNDVVSLQDGGEFNARFSLIQSPADAINGEDDHNIFGKDPKLGPLQDNGGPTRTHNLKAASPAINAGSNALAAGLDTDQNGDPRIVNGTVDIGAVEFSGLSRVVRRWFRTR